MHDSINEFMFFFEEDGDVDKDYDDIDDDEKNMIVSIILMFFYYIFPLF